MKSQEQPVESEKRLYLSKRIIIGSSIVGGLAFMTFAVVFGEHGYLAFKRSVAEEQRLQKAVKASEDRHNALKLEIRRLETDPRLIEALARQEFIYIKKNESVIKIVEPPPATEAGAEAGK